MHHHPQLLSLNLILKTPLCLGPGGKGLFRYRLAITDNGFGRVHVNVHLNRMWQVPLFLALIEGLPIVNVLAVEKSRIDSLNAFLLSLALLVDAKAIPPPLQTWPAVRVLLRRLLLVCVISVAVLGSDSTPQ